MKTLFGGSESESTSSSGYAALPNKLKIPQKILAGLSRRELLANPEDYYRPMDLTTQEQMVGQMISPANIQSSIEQYLNPYRNIITSDINKAYQDQFGGLAQQASEAGAFGGSRYRQGQGDLERARLDAIANAMSGQYNTAYNKYQQGLGNLLGFGGLQRQLDLSQRQALPTAMRDVSAILSPQMSTSMSTQKQSNGGGLLGAVGGLASGLGGVGSAMGLMGGYDPFSGITWNSGRVM